MNIFAVHIIWFVNWFEFIVLLFFFRHWQIWMTLFPFDKWTSCFFFFFPFQFHYSFWIIPLYSVHIFNLISKRLWIFHSNIIQYRLRCNPRHGRKSIWVFSRANTRGHLWCLWINIWREQFCNAMWLSLRHPLKCVHIYIHKYI